MTNPLTIARMIDFKQWGEYDAEGTRVGKTAAGRLLDGVQLDGRPR